jgi:hypothetical protein
MLFSTGCSFMAKTPIVADYQKLNLINQMSTKNDVEKMLGTPQGVGVHIVNGHTYDLTFYYGLAGRFSLFGSANIDTGTAFISYQANNLADLLYFTSMATGPKISFDIDFPIKKLSEKLILGKSNISVVCEIMGQPQYKGRWIDKSNKVAHSVFFWDASQIQNNSAIKEKWLLIGFDNQEIVQDLNWVSSMPEDIKDFGEISEQNLKQLTRFTMAGFLPYFEPQSISTSTKIDPIQIDAVLKSNPTNIKTIKDIIGTPTAIGIRSFKNNSPLILSNWSFSKIEMKGYEDNFIPIGASKEEIEKSGQLESYMVMDVTQSRLIVGHNIQGEIKEILWIKPIK